MIDPILTAFISALIVNIFWAYAYWRLRCKRTKRLDSGATDLLHALTRRGEAILRVQVLDSENLLLRSPRG